MEGYAVDGLAATGELPGGGVMPSGLAAVVAAAEAAEPGSGPVVARAILLVRGAGQLVTLEDMEVLAVEESRRIGRDAVQLALDNQAFAECWLPGVTGSDGAERTRKADSGRSLLTMLGHVTVRRAAYLSGDKGVRALHPRDAVLNLPPGGFSWQFRRLAEMTCRSGTYDSAAQIVRAVTGEHIWGRQLQEMMTDCAADAEEFAQARPAWDPPVRKTGDGTQRAATGVASADGKGVSMLKRDLREDAARRAANKDGPAARKLGSGEKSATKRMAETCVVYESLPPDGDPRTPEEIMRRPRGERGRYPKALSRTYTCDITACCADVIEEGVFAEIDRRDPGHERQWIGLIDGNLDQIRAFTGKAAERGMDMPLLIDFIHVLEYLWKAGWCFVRPGDIAAAEALVTGWGEDILHGRSADVIADIEDKAATDPPKPGSEHARNIRKTLTYLRNKEPYLDYPRALENGWPISTGIIEGACRHLVADRMSVSGARWSLPGAQSVLWMRAINASGDTETYWNHHIRAEHQRNHLSKYQNPAAILPRAA